METESKVITCILCHETDLLNQRQIERHVAILHAGGTFSTMRCGVCNGKYYDFRHFEEHLGSSEICSEVPCKLMQEPLSYHTKEAFHALVKQIIRPVNDENQLPPARSLAPHISNINKTRSPLDLKPMNKSGPIIDYSSVKSVPLADLSNFGGKGTENFSAAHFNNQPTPAEVTPVKVTESATWGDALVLLTPLKLGNDGNVEKMQMKDVKEEMEKSDFGENGMENDSGIGNVTDSTMVQEGENMENGMKNDSGIEAAPNTPIRKCNGIVKEAQMILMQNTNVKGRQLECNICRKMIMIKKTQRGKIYYMSSDALTHAAIHTTVPRFCCPFCDYQVFTRKPFRSHLRQVHDQGRLAVTWDYLSNEAIVDIKDTFSRCFSYQQDEVEQESCSGSPKKHPNQTRARLVAKAMARRLKKKSGKQSTTGVVSTSPVSSNTERDRNNRNENARVPIAIYGRQIADKYGNGRTIKCRACGQTVSFTYQRPGPVRRDYRAIIDHARRHVNKPIFKCNLCGNTRTTYALFSSHVMSRHPTQRIKDICADSSDQYEPDVMAKLDECFDHSRPAPATPVKVEKLKTIKLENEPSASIPNTSTPRSSSTQRHQLSILAFFNVSGKEEPKEK